MNTSSTHWQLQHKIRATLIKIARVSKELHTAFVRDAITDLQGARVRNRLDRIFITFQSILNRFLDENFTVDGPLRDWIYSKEPDMCLTVLVDMEKVLTSNHLSGTRLWGIIDAVRSAYAQDKYNEAVKLFIDREHLFRFLFTLKVKDEADVQLRDGIVLARSPGIEKVDSKKVDTIFKWLCEEQGICKHNVTVLLHQPGTCTWLPETPEYKAWRCGKTAGFLWLYGKLGAGKTVLTASLIRTIEDTLQGDENLAFFYFDFGHDQARSAARAMLSILFQLLHKLHDAPGEDLVRLVDEIILEKERGTPCSQDAMRLAHIISRVSRQFGRRPLVVIDALDECNGIKSLLGALKVLIKGELRLFVTSRPLQVIRNSLGNLPFISMDNMELAVSLDIKLYVDEKVDSDGLLGGLDHTLKKKVCSALYSNADGMFRWVQCQFEVLKQGVSVQWIEDALESLPVGLDETYERVLRDVHKKQVEGKIIRRALTWLVAALRPLRLTELMEGLAIDLQRRLLDRRIAPVHGPALLDALGSLVTHDERSGVVVLAHSSVKEYLTGECICKNLPEYRIDLQEAHEQLFQLCMCYVSVSLPKWARLDAMEPQHKSSNGPVSRRFQRDSVLSRSVMSDHTSSRSDSTQSRLKYHTEVVLSQTPLLDYVFSHCFAHLANLTRMPMNDSVLDSMHALRSDMQQCSVGWGYMCKFASAYPHLTTWLTPNHDFLIYVLIESFPAAFLSAFLHHVPFNPLDRTNPLVYAAHFGRIEHARIYYLSSPPNSQIARMNNPGWAVGEPRQVSPLEAALYCGHGALVDLFLMEWNASASSQLFSTAFDRPRSEYPPQYVARLLQTDEFAEWAVDVQDPTLLLRALDQDRYWNTRITEGILLLMIRRLVQVGCDFVAPDLFGRVHRTLAWAASEKYASVLEYLSRLGVSIPFKALPSPTGIESLVHDLTSQKLAVESVGMYKDAVHHHLHHEPIYGSSSCHSDVPRCPANDYVLSQSLTQAPHSNVVFIGETGGGKSSIINIVVDEDVAKVSNDIMPCTPHFASYDTSFGGRTYTLWDTPGLDWGFGLIVPAVEDVLASFLRYRYLCGGLDLIVYCLSSDRLREAAVSAYTSFCEPFRAVSVPVVVAVTYLEHVQPSMDAWWEDNESAMEGLGLVFDGHACVTGLPYHLRSMDTQREMYDLLSKDYPNRTKV